MLGVKGICFDQIQVTLRDSRTLRPVEPKLSGAHLRHRLKMFKFSKHLAVRSPSGRAAFGAFVVHDSSFPHKFAPLLATRHFRSGVLRLAKSG